MERIDLSQIREEQVLADIIAKRDQLILMLSQEVAELQKKLKELEDENNKNK